MTDNHPSSNPNGDTGTPRWAKVFVVIVILLLLLVVVMMLTGGHGPGVHTP